MASIRAVFAELSAPCRASRSSSLLEQLLRASSSSRDGSSEGSSNACKVSLLGAAMLDTMIVSLHMQALQVARDDAVPLVEVQWTRIVGWLKLLMTVMLFK
jgi:hypothetical protein